MTCRRCGMEFVLLPCFDGRERRFNTAEIADVTVPLDQRWYWRRRTGAVNASVANVPADMPYFTVHRCDHTRLMTGQSPDHEIGRLHAGTEIALRVDIPFTTEFKVRGPEYAYSYWYSSAWAHIIRGAQLRGLCGDRTLDPDRMSPREAERIPNMRVCPRCARRYDPEAYEALHSERVRQLTEATLPDREPDEPASASE